MATADDDDGGREVDDFGDQAVAAIAGGWYARADDGQKFAVALVAAAAVLGPLGQGLLAALETLYSSKLPSAEQVEAVFWLAVLTLPVFAAAAAGLYFAGRLASGAVLAVAALAAVGGFYAMVAFGVPTHLGDVYCYNDGRVLERTCRDFDEWGFTSRVSSADSPTEILSIAYVYTADARGGLMAACGVVAGLGCGYLARRETTG